MSLPNGPHCPSCILCSPGCASGFVPNGDGKQTCGVMLVGETGQQDARQEKAFLGSSGFLLQRIFARRGWHREEFRYTSILRCYPEKGLVRNKWGAPLPWLESAADSCQKYLDAEIAQWKPKCIVTLGPTAFTRLTGLTAENLHLRKDLMKSVHGYAFRDVQDRTWVVPTFHTDFLQKGQQHLAQVLMWDVEKARRIASEGYQYDTPTCLMDPSPSAWDNYVREALDKLRAAHTTLAADIENPFKAAQPEDELAMGDLDSVIDRISFCYEVDRGVSVPWQMPYVIGAKALLEASVQQQNRLLFWNRAHDRPRLQRNLGIQLPLTHVEDPMLQWHVLYNNLEKSLGFVTSCAPMGRSHGLRMWKHLSRTEPEYYSVVDAIALLRNHLDITERLHATGQYDVYRLRIQACAPVTEFMSLQGLGVDVAGRLVFREEVAKALDAVAKKIDASVPEAVKGERIWRSRGAAEKGFARLLANGEAEGTFEEKVYQTHGSKQEQTCGTCGEHPVTRPHVAKKQIPVAEANARLPGIAVMAVKTAEHTAYLAKLEANKAAWAANPDDDNVPF